jgi:hypothetical protein
LIEIGSTVFLIKQSQNEKCDKAALFQMPCGGK